MRLLYTLLFVLVSAFTSVGQNLPDKPNPPRMVNDFANLLSPQEQQQLEQKFRAYNDTTSNQIAIVTVATLDGYDISEYAFALGRKWGIGQKGKNNGILILVKPKAGSEKGKVFIATGYGMEGAITDARSNRLIDEVIIPAFQKKQYYQGLDEATTALIQMAKGEYKADKKGAGKVSPLSSLLVFIIIAIIFAVIAAVGRARRNAGSVYSSTGYQSRTSSLPWWLLLMGMGSGFGGGHSSSGGWNDFSGGGGGSDFGGFGGGDFGGGGAGGDW
jgi:uncharacterized protein